MSFPNKNLTTESPASDLNICSQRSRRCRGSLGERPVGLRFNGNSRILKWRYVSTIFLAIFWGYIPLHSNYIDLIYGRYLQFRFLKWPLTISNAEWGVFRSHAIVRRKGLQLSNCKQDQLGMFRLFSHEHGYFETHSSANLRKHQQLYLVAQAMRSHPRDDILGL